MVVVVVCAGNVVVVLVVDGVGEVVVVEGCDGSTVVGDIFFASGGTAIARRAGAVVGGMVTLVEVVWAAAVGSGAVARDEEPAW
jgi:hypothetical protein